MRDQIKCEDKRTTVQLVFKVEIVFGYFVIPHTRRFDSYRQERLHEGQSNLNFFSIMFKKNQTIPWEWSYNCPISHIISASHCWILNITQPGINWVTNDVLTLSLTYSENNGQLSCVNWFVSCYVISRSMIYSPQTIIPNQQLRSQNIPVSVFFPELSLRAKFSPNSRDGV